MAKIIKNWLGPGGGLKGSYGTCTVGNTVSPRLTRLENVFVTYSDARGGSQTCASATSIDSEEGTFVASGQAGATVFWLAFGY